MIVWQRLPKEGSAVLTYYSYYLRNPQHISITIKCFNDSAIYKDCNYKKCQPIIIGASTIATDTSGGSAVNENTAITSTNGYRQIRNTPFGKVETIQEQPLITERVVDYSGGTCAAMQEHSWQEGAESNTRELALQGKHAFRRAGRGA